MTQITNKGLSCTLVLTLRQKLGLYSSALFCTVMLKMYFQVACYAYINQNCFAIRPKISARYLSSWKNSDSSLPHETSLPACDTPDQCCPLILSSARLPWWLTDKSARGGQLWQGRPWVCILRLKATVHHTRTVSRFQIKIIYGTKCWVKLLGSYLQLWNFSFSKGNAFRNSKCCNWIAAWKSSINIYNPIAFACNEA